MTNADGNAERRATNERSPVDLVLRDGMPRKGDMPVRYPVHAGDRDALLMARVTVWSEVGRTGVQGRGKKMWMTNAGDMALLDIRTCEFLTGEQNLLGTGQDHAPD